MASMFLFTTCVQALMSEVELWGRWQASFTTDDTEARDADNPFFTQFLVHFQHNEQDPQQATPANESTAVVRGFYDGDRTYTVRFMPPATGQWSYRTASNVSSLDGHEGSFKVTPASSDNHGPVVVSPGANATTFRYADGTPFFSVGTTVYGLFGGWSPGDPLTNRTLESLRVSPFNKVRIMAFPVGSVPTPVNGSDPLPVMPYQPLGGASGAASDLMRFNLGFWRRIERIVDALGVQGIQADIILFNLYMANYPAGLKCLGGPNASSYDLFPDIFYLRYMVARLGSYRNVWWSMSNEWNQCACKFPGAGINPCPAQRDFSDPGCGEDGANSPAGPTPIWDALFETVRAEEPSGSKHLMSIHNNGYLYNYSRPWITHFSIQHTHNKPKTLWRLYGKKPYVYDEVKYEGNNAQNWGSLSAPQMVQRFWWAASQGAHGGHGEVLDIAGSARCGAPNSWSGPGGYLCGESPSRIAWFRAYMENGTLHPPFEACEGDDDGFVHTLTCAGAPGADPEREPAFLMFHFYNAHPYANNSFQYINLPTGFKMRQDLLQPWEKRISLIWAPPSGFIEVEPRATPGADNPASMLAPPPPGARVWGPVRGAGWAPVGITVDEDTVPHILTFTALSNTSGYGRGRWLGRDFATFEREAHAARRRTKVEMDARSEQQERERYADHGLDLPW